jgi:hypothetical protein
LEEVIGLKWLPAGTGGAVLWITRLSEYTPREGLLCGDLASSLLCLWQC